MLVLAAVVLTLSLSNDLMAQGGKNQNKKQIRTNFVDLDGDGICDNSNGAVKMNKGASMPAFIDADGDGVCDNAGTSQGKGKRINFIDADGDGVCDNAANPVKQRLQDGTGSGSGTQNGLRKRGSK